ncbi:hypothetical protein RRG08_023639 [Elysia crispata]|uniref:SSD domain-containing protein n=1 Tax=Elysia crispata TaxID=231223 RepID=A0AAE0XSR4_9GAST|nr:hypothetical protein RRG08_023639 [Elysia crispata]
MPVCLLPAELRILSFLDLDDTSKILRDAACNTHLFCYRRATLILASPSSWRIMADNWSFRVQQGRLPPIENAPKPVPTEYDGMDKQGHSNGGLDNNGYSPPPGDANGTTSPTVDIEQEKIDPEGLDPPPAKPEHPSKPPLLLCSFIANKTKTAFFLFLGGHIFFVVISSILILAGVDLIPIEFQQVPLNIDNDDTYLRNFAWRYRDEDPLILSVNTSAAFVGERTKDGDFLQIFFKGGGNVLTKERLQAIEDVENDLTGKPEWKNFCKQTITNGTGTCVKPISLIRFFDCSMEGFCDPDFSDIKGILYNASLQASKNEILKGLVAKSSEISPTVATSDVTRMVMFTGVPRIPGDLTSDSIDDQYEDIMDFLVDNFKGDLESLNSDGVAGMKVFYSSYQLLLDAIFDQVFADMALAVGSFLFIFLFMLFQTGSLFLTSLAITTIMTSFLGCNLIYRIVFDFRYFGIFHVLSIFIILGIGADNIFVFNDTWRGTAHENHPNLAERLSSCYRRASKSMMNTSLTTFAAFMSNFLSPLMGVNTFGIFSATLVMVNFLSAIIFFPSCVMMYHKYWKDWSWPCFEPCRRIRIYPCAPKDKSKTGHRPNAVVRFFKGPFHRVITHKIFRWIFILVCVAMAGTFVYFATKTEISKEPLQLYREGHNYYEAAKLDFDAFELPLDDRNVKVMLMFGLKNQDRGSCHKSDFECKGKSVFDNAFDMNPKPAQTQLMKLCEEIETMQGDLVNELRLKKSADTGLVEIDCFVVALNTYLESQETDYTPPLSLSLPTSEINLIPFFENNTDLYNLTHVDTNFYRYFETMNSYWLNNGYTGVPLPEYGTYSILVGQSVDDFDTAPILSDPSKKYGTRLRYAAVEITLSLLHSSVDFEEGLEIYNNWEKFADEKIANLPPSLQGGVQFTPGLNERNAWHEFKRQEALAGSAFQGIWIGISLAYVVLAFATMNLIIALMATIIILLVTISVTAFIPILGWEISVIESINLSLVVGLAVDYVVHFSEAYHTSPQKHRTDKVRDMLEHMGVSVISGAFSTLGAASFMMAAQIQFFLQFGVFLFLTIGFSLTYSLFLFTPLLSVIGPEGNTGSMLPAAKYIWNKVIRRKKVDQKGDTRKAKGHDPPYTSEPRDIEDTPMQELKTQDVGHKSANTANGQGSAPYPSSVSPDAEIPSGTVIKL